MLSASSKPVSPYLPGPVQHAVARPFARRPATQALPMVSIDDCQTLEHLQSQGMPYWVSCELPAQVSSLPRYGVRHEHVRLLLDPTVGTDEDVKMAFFKALLRFEQATSLAIHYNGKATPDAMNTVCEQLASCTKAPASLKLHFRGASTEQPLSGMKQLLCERPGMVLTCKGSLAISAAIACLERSTPGATKLKALEFVGVAGDDSRLIECLIQVRNTDLHIHLRFNDATDPDDFITSLLEAGVWAGLQLSCHTPDGRSADLQERLEACRAAHLNRLLGLCTQDGRLDHQKLLAHCQTIYGGGAQLFAWACGIAGTAETEDLPEVPLALRGYWLTLSHSQVVHAVCCKLPADTPALADPQVKHILGLRIDFGDMTDTDAQMPIIDVDLQRMERLATCVVHHRGATPAFGDWLFRCLRNLPIEQACFDLGGTKTDNSFRTAIQFLSKPSLNVVTCKDMLTASLLLIALRHVIGPLSIQLKLNVPPEHEMALVNYLAIGTKDALRLGIHFSGDHVPTRLMDILNKALGKKQPQILVKWLDISSQSYTMPLDSPLTLRLARRHISTKMRAARRDLARKPDMKQYRAAQKIDMSLVKAFASSIGNSYDESSDVPQASRDRISAAASTMSAADVVLDNLLSWLKPMDLQTLSSTHKTIRSHGGIPFPVLQEGMANWVRSMAPMEWPLDHYRTILLKLFEQLTPEQLSDEFLQESLQPPVQATEET